LRRAVTASGGGLPSKSFATGRRAEPGTFGAASGLASSFFAGWEMKGVEYK
jgi:hypothetical protein